MWECGRVCEGEEVGRVGMNVGRCVRGREEHVRERESVWNVISANVLIL